MLLLAAAVMVGGVAAQEAPDLRGELIRRAAEKGLTREQTEAILTRADRLASNGLPVRPVLDRYLQGLAKGVELPRIEAVVDQLETTLRNSAGCVDQVFPPAPRQPGSAERLTLIEHGAYALAAGVPTDDLTATMRLGEQGNGGPSASVAPVLAMGCLVGGGAEAAASLQLVQTAWVHGYRGADLEKLGRDLGALGRDGHGPSPELMQRVMGMIRDGAEHERLFRDLDHLRGPERPGPGAHPPGMMPGEDPTHMGPGGPPQDPGHTGPGGHHPPPPHGGS